MADDVIQRVEDAFQTLVSITEKSGNLRKDLKDDILISVSTLRKEFSQLKIQLENVNRENKNPKEVTNATKEAATRRESHNETSGAISGPRAAAGELS